MRILAINLGSTSTKVGVFEDHHEVISHTFRHPKEEIKALSTVLEQKDYRKRVLEAWLMENNLSLSAFDVFSVRCGLIRPVEGGIYRINQAVVSDAASGRYEMHAANLGLIIGYEWAQEYHKPAIFVDAPVTDELQEVARVSGFAGVKRRTAFHALNAKRTVRLYCEQHQLDPKQGNYIVVHMGGGISVSAIQNLRVIDVNNAVDGEGPFSPERVGGLTNAAILSLLQEVQGDTKALRAMLYQQGGLQSYFGTNDVKALLERAQTEPEVRLVLSAMIYNVLKQIAAMAMALNGQVDQILITGGLAYNQVMVEEIAKKSAWIAPSSAYPGEDELRALAEGALRFLNGQEEAKVLKEEDHHA